MVPLRIVSDSPVTNPEKQRHPSLNATFFWAAVLAEGACVMLIQILGTRVVGPVFGVGLYVWSALITVTLGALALGYGLGGALVDRRPKVQLFYGVLAAAGVWLALLPLLSRPVLLFVSPLGLRAGPIAGSLLLFAPVLTLLGMMSPIAIRLQTSVLASAGRTAGRVYATSTVAGVLSALLTGYWLISSFAVNTIWISASSVLLGIAALGLMSRGASIVVAMLPLIAALGTLDKPQFVGKDLRIVEAAQSAYSKLSVVEDTSRSVPLRLLRANHSFIGAEWAGGQPAFAFLHLMEALKLAKPDGHSLLLLGLGVGSLPILMEKRGVTSDVVEIDAEVVRLARTHFHFKPNGEVFVEDARTFVKRKGKRYDFVVHDTFTGGDNPDHLLSLEMMLELKGRLAPEGIALVNLVGADRGDLSTPAQAFNRTIRSAFKYVRVFRDGPPNPTEDLSNLLFFAADSPISFPDIPGFDYGSETGEQTLKEFRNWETLKDVDPLAPMILDAENPMNRLSLPVSEAFHRHLNEMHGPEFWVN